jgi:hypothetical protein
VSRRSPSNERYQKFTEPAGKTRKSAAAAKPVRKEGGASTTKSKSKSSSGSGTSKGYSEPDTVEYRYWKKLWWISLGIGLALVAVSFLIQYVIKATGPLRIAGVICIGLAYVAIIAAFLIDWQRMRPMRTGTWVAPKPKPKPAKLAEKPAAPTDTIGSGPTDSDDAGSSGDAQ